MNSYPEGTKNFDTNRDRVLSFILGIVTIVMVVAGAAFVLKIGVDMIIHAEDKRASVECYNLQDQAQAYKNQGFYITKEEKLQCDFQGIEIDAPVAVRPLFKN